MAELPSSLPSSQPGEAKPHVTASNTETRINKVAAGRIYLFLGTSTAGKSTIIGHVKKNVEDCLEFSIDVFGPSHDSDLVKQHLPEKYGELAKVMHHADISHAIFGNVYTWIPGTTDAQKEQALKIIEEVRSFDKERPGVLHEPFEKVEALMLKEIIKAAKTGKHVVFDLDNPKKLEKLISEQGLDIPISRGLVYCPLPILIERAIKRNQEALSTSGNASNWRSPVMCLHDFIHYYKGTPGATADKANLDTLTRSDVEKAVDRAYQEEENPPQNHPVKEDLKKEMLQKLGFTSPEITLVTIQPVFNRPDMYELFNTAMRSRQELEAQVESFAHKATHTGA